MSEFKNLRRIEVKAQEGKQSVEIRVETPTMGVIFEAEVSDVQIVLRESLSEILKVIDMYPKVRK